jgi:hypothetical protein
MNDNSPRHPAGAVALRPTARKPPRICCNRKKAALSGGLLNLLKGGDSLTQGDWRKVLKLRVIAQTIAAIVSAIAAIYRLLER